MAKLKSLNIVLLGNWNKRIFSPTWVSSNLFELPAGSSYDGLVNAVEMEFGYQHDNIIILPRSYSLEIKLNKFDDKTMVKGGIVLCKVLELLPHTPIKALGINYRYIISKKSKNKITPNLNNLNCNFNDFQTTQIKFSKQMEDCLLNLVTDFDEDRFHINFNFHFNDKTQIDKNILVSKYLITEKFIK